MRLQGKVALVTGAADKRNIGWGIAAALAAEGADVAVNDVTKLDELAQRSRDLRAMGRRSIDVPGDVSKPADVEHMIARSVAELGRLDIVASNAGVIRWESVLEVTPANLRQILDVNLKGNFYVCQAAAKQMIAQGTGGRIIITSSVQADIHFPITPVYGGTKNAMHPFVATLALELAPFGITVNHVGPGWVQSPLNDPAPGQQTAAEIEAQRQAVPLKRAGLIEEMGRAVVYFASDDGAYTTGAFLRVDGGLGAGKF